MRHLLPLLLSALVSLSASAGTFRVPLLRKPPVLDGKIDPAEWARSAGFDGLAYNNVLDRRRARVRVAATPTHLYLAIQSQLPAEGELLAKVDKDTVKVVFDDSIEVWIDPTPGSEHGQAFQMLANSLGRTGYKHHGRGRVQENPTWKGNWQVANGMHDGWWFCEIAIPIASIALDRIASQGSWGINICRNWKQPWAFSSTGGGPYSPTDTFTFSPDALAIAHVVRDDVVAGKIDTTLALTNPSDKPVTVKASLEIARDAMPTLAVNETLTVVPGQTLPLRLKADDQNTKKFALAIRVASPDGKTVHYARQYKWALGKAWQWTTKKKEVLPIDFQFTYSPYRKHIQVLVDTGNLPQGAQVDRLAVAVRKKGAPKALKTMTFIDGRLPAGQNEPVLMTHPLKASALGVKRLELRSVMRLAMFQRGVERADRPKQELLGFPVLLESGKVVPLRDVAGFTKPVPWDIRPRGHRWRLDFHVPAIDEGVYEIAVRAEGKGVPTGERVKEFERTRFEWERKGLGTSTKVYAPFTPIAVKGDRVDTVLREHTMNGFGLWDQVIARGRPLLAKPMRFVAQVGGKDVPLTAWTPHFTQKDPHRAVAHSAFAGGPVHGHVVSAWDVDGMMRVDLSLASAQTATVESVRLEIPLADDLAPLMHAMGDGIRNTVYAPVPKGDGVVWDSSKVQVNDFPANFCSYIYLGNGVRGLAWFAENDRGWSWDSAKPNLDLVRRDGQLILRVHLINKPVNLWRPRIITFGLQAAPVKPRIANWRYIWKRENYTLLGTDINWLARGNCGSVYPAGKDMFLWDMIKRGNREKLSREAVQKTIDHGKKYFEPYGPQVVETFVRHVPHNLLSRHGTKMVFYYNRASCQLFPEFQTFQDEWCLSDTRTVGKGTGRGEIKIVPTASYIDHALWWYGKSFDVGANQGVYWDNMFLAASYNTAHTAAYRRRDGTIVPSNGLWGLRELVKRTFIHMNEKGMMPITMAHMTSTGILPILSFCTVQYDWEWKYSRGDVQYRFPREYIQLVTTGELAGAWPVLLGEHGKLAQDEWTQRTFAGVCLVHELDGWGAGKAWSTLFKHVHRLVETPGVEVYRHWDDRPLPVTSGHDDLPVIVYAVKGKEALFAVTGYAEQNENVTLTIDSAALGIAAYRIVDAETDEPVTVANHRIAFTLKKHDVRAFRLLPRAE